MDDLVRQALARWPDVPAIAGWLRLSARGEWLLTGEVPAGLRINHPNMRRFIDRNYASDSTGRWFFQNGPQKVYVSLEYTPWVVSVHPVPGDACCLLTHTRIATVPSAVWLDDGGQFIFQTPMGPAVMRDTDMEVLTAYLSETAEGWVLRAPWVMPSDAQCTERDWTRVGEAANEPLGGPAHMLELPVQSIVRAEVPARFSFNPQPAV